METTKEMQFHSLFLTPKSILVAYIETLTSLDVYANGEGLNAAGTNFIFLNKKTAMAKAS